MKQAHSKTLEDSGVRRVSSYELPKLCVLMGKGGVGRSTLAAAMGLACARRGARVVIVEVAARQCIPEIFGVEAKGYEPVQCVPGLLAIRVTWEDALREYGLLKLRFRYLYRLVFENALLRRVLPAIPGIPEILVIGKVLYVATDGLQDGRRCDMVVLDAPATGHSISLLSAPFVISDTVPAGPLAEDARRLAALLRDGRFTRFHIVAAPEEMPVEEGIELYRQMAERYGVPFGPVLMNLVQRRGLDGEHKRLLRACVGTLDGRVRGLLRAALFMEERAEMQRSHIMKFANHVPLPILEIPDLVGALTPRQKLELIADYLEAFLLRGAS